MKFAIKDFFSKCDQIRKKLRIWSPLLNKSLMENLIFWAVIDVLIHFKTVKAINKMSFDRSCSELLKEKSILKIFGKLQAVHMHRGATFCKVVEVDRQQTYKNCTTDFVEYFQYS